MSRPISNSSAFHEAKTTSGSDQYYQMYKKLWEEYPGKKNVIYLRVGALPGEEELACLRGRDDVVSIKINEQGNSEMVSVLLKNSDLSKIGGTVRDFKDILEKQNVTCGSIERQFGTYGVEVMKVRVAVKDIDQRAEMVNLPTLGFIKYSTLVNGAAYDSEFPISAFKKEVGSSPEGRFILGEAFYSKSHSDGLIRFANEAMDRGATVIYEDSTHSSGQGIIPISKTVFDSLSKKKNFVPILFSGFDSGGCEDRKKYVRLVVGFKNPNEYRVFVDDEVTAMRFNNDEHFLTNAIAKDYSTGSLLFKENLYQPVEADMGDRTDAIETDVGEGMNEIENVIEEPGIVVAPRGCLASCLSKLSSVFRCG